MNVQQVPDIIFSTIAKNSFQALAPAWFEIKTNSEEILNVGGEWQHYFLEQPVAGQDVSQACEMLIGMLPMTENFELPQMQLLEHCYTDIFAIHDTNSDWLLFCDVTEKTNQLQTYQQTSNDLILIKDRLSRTLNRYVGQEVSERVNKGELKFDAAGERREISTLFVDIRGFTPFNECNDAQVVMQTLNAYMNCMLDSIMGNAGMVDKIIGDGVMAVFGVLPSQNHYTHDAFSAAQQIQTAVAQLNEQRLQAGLDILGVGVGIATGEAVLGILGTHERRAFTAIGRHVNLAARLESNARKGEILMDEATYIALEKPHALIAVTLALKDIGETQAYALLSNS
ncbi:MAG: hypothetical protein AUK35_00600 [Zetaproteobacteria bacterium CG2_30_46_52]|nr:MAG: hypothetical protein AUK35_00600 [Zetaproteobacteria bacterium CG2_30_46_52]